MSGRVHGKLVAMWVVRPLVPNLLWPCGVRCHEVRGLGVVRTAARAAGKAT
jgi:hypothetical protein